MRDLDSADVCGPGNGARSGENLYSCMGYIPILLDTDVRLKAKLPRTGAPELKPT